MSAAERRSAEVGGRGFRRGKRFGRFGFPRLRVVLLFAVVGFVICSEICLNYDRLPEQRDFPVLENPIENRIENPIENPIEKPIENPNELLDSLQREAEQKILRRSVDRPPPPPRRNKRRKHSPCEVELSDSVDYFLKPNDVNNFTRFQLEYVDREDRLSLPGASEPKFGGHQTLNARENSYNAQDQTLHCGFVKEPLRHQSSGFDLDEKDLTYMKTCKIVVSSCIFGNSDYLRKPEKRKVSEYSKKNVCFVMFLDEKTLAKLSSEGDIPDEKGNIGLWRIVVVKNLPYDDMRRTGKVPKLLSHRLFPSSRYSIWIDSKMKLRTDPLRILEYFLWRTKSEYAISNHYDRHCVWDEVLQNKRLNKYDHTAIDKQFAFYQSDGLTKFDPSDPNNLIPSYVPEGSFIVRAHTPMSNLFSCLWFNEVDRFTSRDQLSFAYTYLKLRRMNPNQPFHLNMFKDCERRAITKLFHHRVMKKI